jgi:hypothetical protein
MTDMYLLAVVRMKELRRQAEVSRRGKPPRTPRARIVLATWLVALARRLSPEATRYAIGGMR